MTTATQVLGGTADRIGRLVPGQEDPIRHFFRTIAEAMRSAIGNRRNMREVHVLQALGNRTMTDVGTAKSELHYAILNRRRNEAGRECRICMAILHQ